MKGGREIVDEAIRKNEKESHDAQEEAKRAEEVVECARLIGTFTEVLASEFVFNFRINNHFYDVAELSPPPKPYNPALKEALDMVRIANEVVDEAINRLLNETAEKVLKED
jgi:hypothetical protein